MTVLNKKVITDKLNISGLRVYGALEYYRIYHYFHKDYYSNNILVNFKLGISISL